MTKETSPRKSQERVTRSEGNFVGRTEETALFSQQLELVKQGRDTQILCFSGSLGTGKTTLLDHLQAEAEDDNHVQVARFDFAVQDDKITLASLLSSLADDLDLQLENPADASEFVDGFIGRFGLYNQQTAVILFDNYHLCPRGKVDNPGVKKLFDQQVLDCLLSDIQSGKDKARFLIVAVGQGEWWAKSDQLKIKRRIEGGVKQLANFDAHLVSKQLGVWLEKAREIVKFTGGHPLANLLVYKQGSEAGLASFKELVYEGLTKRTRQLADYLIVQRWVSIDKVQSLVEYLSGQEIEANAANELIHTLIIHGLIVYEKTRNYYIPTQVGQALSSCLELNQPDVFEDAHERARIFYSHHLCKYAQYLERYLPELLFHAAHTGDIGK